MISYYSRFEFFLKHVPVAQDLPNTVYLFVWFTGYCTGRSLPNMHCGSLSSPKKMAWVVERVEYALFLNICKFKGKERMKNKKWVFNNSQVFKYFHLMKNKNRYVCTEKMACIQCYPFYVSKLYSLAMRKRQWECHHKYVEHQ